MDSAGGVERYAAFRKVVPFAWREHPFEWVEGQRFGVLREFQHGVFAWFMSLVELQPRSGGGTRLVQHIRLVPRGLGGRLMAHLQLARGGRRSLENVYRRIDAVVSGKVGPLETTDPFEEPVKLVDAKRARDWSGHLMNWPRVASTSRSSSGWAVSWSRPLIPRSPASDPWPWLSAGVSTATRWWPHAFMEPGKDYSSCSGTSSARSAGSRARSRTRCGPLPTMAIARHATWIIHSISPARSSSCFALIPKSAASTSALIALVDRPIFSMSWPRYASLAANASSWRSSCPKARTACAGPQLPWSVDFQVQVGAATRLWEISLAAGPAPDHVRSLRAGHQVLTFFNELERELVVRVERTALRTDALTAARAGSLALFRELFPGEVLSPGQLATVATVTLLVAELDPLQADALYQDLDDSRAFNVLQAFFHLLDESIRKLDGAVVKTVGEGLLAAFPDPVSAVRWGLGLHEHLSHSDLARNLRLRAAIHRGTALAANINDHLDYFGLTARQVFKLSGQIQPNELALAPAVAADPGVAALLETRGIEPEVVTADTGGLPYLIRIRLE